MYIAGWIGWVRRNYLIAISDEKKPAMKEIIIDVQFSYRLKPKLSIFSTVPKPRYTLFH